MGFFKWLDKHIRESNDNWHQSYVEEQRRKKAEEEGDCCANCLYFSIGHYRGAYYCSKLNFRYDYDDANINRTHYKKICNHFIRK